MLTNQQLRTYRGFHEIQTSASLMYRFATALVLSSFWVTVSAQVIPFDSSAWDIEAVAHQIMDYRGQQALFIKGGAAVLNVPAFTNGEIEFDIAFSGERSFSGARWRVVADGNFEEFYIRPHLSGMPDANQYTPVNNGHSAWQLYHGPQYSAPIRYQNNKWQHVRIVFKDDLADVYVDSDAPVLTVELMRSVEPGTVSVYASNFAPAFFSNFEYTASDVAAVSGEPVSRALAPEGTVSRWMVSNPFVEGSLEGRMSLPETYSQLTWQSLDADKDGITNLAGATADSDGQNTVFAKVTVDASSDGTQLVRFGYSDRVRVFVNGELVYVGSNGYMSRDYRYLGTIGLFDELAIPLKSGENELLFAVSEDFGGWGVIAQFVDPSAVSVTAPR